MRYEPYVISIIFYSWQLWSEIITATLQEFHYKPDLLGTQCFCRPSVPLLKLHVWRWALFACVITGVAWVFGSQLQGSLLSALDTMQGHIRYMISANRKGQSSSCRCGKKTCNDASSLAFFYHGSDCQIMCLIPFLFPSHSCIIDPRLFRCHPSVSISCQSPLWSAHIVTN